MKHVVIDNRPLWQLSPEERIMRRVEALEGALNDLRRTVYWIGFGTLICCATFFILTA